MKRMLEQLRFGIILGCASSALCMVMVALLTAFPWLVRYIAPPMQAHPRLGLSLLGLFFLAYAGMCFHDKRTLERWE